jgi:uncharacterized membrane protein
MQTAQTRTTVVWLLVLVATAISFFTSHDHNLAADFAYVSICTLSYFKCRMVIMEFMEVRHAPIGWRLFFELWMLVVIGEIVFFRFAAL